MTSSKTISSPKSPSRTSKSDDTPLPFWRRKSLASLNRAEWEALCDGCARCCLHKLEDEQTGIVHYTAVACRFLDRDTCRCRDYPHRSTRVPDCVLLSAERTSILAQMPPTCAYRLLYEGRDLPDWHPLVSGDPESAHRAGVSVRDRCLDERDVPLDALADYVISLEE